MQDLKKKNPLLISPDPRAPEQGTGLPGFSVIWQEESSAADCGGSQPLGARRPRYGTCFFKPVDAFAFSPHAFAVGLE